MPAPRLRRIALTDFRSYAAAALDLVGGPVFLFGPNGAGKTNVLEAVSFLSPGRGLRGAAVAEVGRREPGEREGRAWSVATVFEGDLGETRIGVGLTPDTGRKIVRLEGETVAPGRLSDLVRLVWLTPAQDRLFLEGASERRRFFDRLVFADHPRHASHVAAYEHALRERSRLLADARQGANPDPAWLDALELKAGEAGAAVAIARAATLQALAAEIAGRVDRPFPQARLDFGGPAEQGALAGEAPEVLAETLRSSLRRGRERDQAAGRALYGPHRTDLAVIHVEKDRPAGECSTGEQKALILNLVLAQAARLARAEGQPAPILLLDEVAAHLDAVRRAALFEDILDLGAQAWMTGTDVSLFAPLGARAQYFTVEDAAVTATR